MSTPLRDRVLDALQLIPVGLVDGAVIAVGMWQLYCTFIVRTGQNFWMLLAGLVVPIALGAVLWARTREREDQSVQPQPEAPSKIPGWVHLVTLTLAVGTLLVWRGYRTDWAFPFMAVVLHLSVLSWHRPVQPQTQSRAGPIDWGLILVSIGIALTATLWIHRPEDDDAFYLNQVLATLRYPELAVLSFDGMHGDVTAPVQQIAHRAQTYEILVAVVTWFSGLIPADVYYIGFPLGASVLLPFATWVIARSMVGTGPARVALVICMGVMAIWGGHYYCYGNFAFARMFQGKGQAVSIFLPLCVYYGIRFAEKPGWRRWSLLTLAQCAAAAFTSTALVVAPVAAALPVLAALKPNRSGIRIGAAGLASALPAVLMLGLIQLDMVSAGGLPGSTGHVRGLEVVLGANQRVNYALCALPLLPTLAVYLRAPQAAWLTRFMLVTFVFLLNGWTTRGLAELGGNLLSWRTYWAVPFPLVVSGLIGMAIVGGLLHRNRIIGVLLVFAGVTYTVGFYNAGRFSWAEQNFAALQYGTWRVPEEAHSVAQTAMVLAGEDSVLLLHPLPSQRISTFENHPEVIAVRRGYTRHLRRFYGGDEANARIRLLRFAEALRGADDLSWHMREFDKRCIDVFVTTNQAERKFPTLRAELERRSFVSFYDSGYQVWYRGDRWSCDYALDPLVPEDVVVGPKKAVPAPPPPPRPRRKKKRKKKR